MNISQSAKKDNIFLASKQLAREKRLSLVVSFVLPCIVCLLAAFAVYAWLINEQFKLSMRQQADAVGQSLLLQTTERASELLAVDDKLGINILLGSLAKNPLVADVGIYDSKDTALFQAGLKQFTHISNADLYKEDLKLANGDSGQLRIRLNRQQFQLPWIVSVERAIIIGGVLLLVALVILISFSASLARALSSLRDWVREPMMPVPGIQRRDEVGDLAKELQNQLIPSEQIEAYYAQFLPVEPEPKTNEAVLDKSTTSGLDELADYNFDESFLKDVASFNKKDATDLDEIVFTDEDLAALSLDETTETTATPPATSTAVLCVRLGGQEKLKLLPKDRLINLLQRYRDCLDQTVRLYKGELHTLSDGSSLVLFHGRGSESETYLMHAICCGELMRGLSHELQVELADTNTTLLLQIAVAQGVDLLGLTPQELFDNETVKKAQALAWHSRNLLLIDQSVASDDKAAGLAKIRGLAHPEDTFCIERVIEPFSQILEKQLRGMRNSKL